MAFDFFSLYKDQNGIRGVTFKQWLDVNVGISDSYGRKLRKISKDFIMFPKLKKLGISFSELWRRKEDIRLMLSIFQHVAAFWREAT
mgnify:CR=1 FL=1